MLQRMRTAKREESGFTLIELLIVIVILGILAAIVVFAVNGIQDRGTASACRADVETVTVAAEAYDAQEGKYAANMDQLVEAGFLHSVPTSSSYTVSYVPTKRAVNVFSQDCLNTQASGTDPGSDYCIELAAALSMYSNIDLNSLDDENFSVFLERLTKLESMAPQDDMKKAWGTFRDTFKKVREILASFGLKWNDLQVLDNGGIPAGMDQESAQKLRNALQEPMNSEEFGRAGQTLGTSAQAICGLKMD